MAPRSTQSVWVWCSSQQRATSTKERPAAAKFCECRDGWHSTEPLFYPKDVRCHVSVSHTFQMDSSRLNFLFPVGEYKAKVLGWLPYGPAS